MLSFGSNLYIWGMFLCENRITMNKQILIFLLVTLFVACSKKRDETKDTIQQVQTPEVLNNEKSNVDINSYSKRASYDIVQQLFDEAIGKDEKLKSISMRIEKIQYQKLDSLAEYQTYMRNNQNYWNALSRYSSQLSDSTLKKELNNLIDALKDKHNKKVAPLTNLAGQIETSERTLKDRSYCHSNT